MEEIKKEVNPESFEKRKKRLQLLAKKYPILNKAREIIDLVRTIESFFYPIPLEEAFEKLEKLLKKVDIAIKQK